LAASISITLLVILLWPEPIQTTDLGRALANWLASLIVSEDLNAAHALVHLEIWLNFLIFIPFAFVLHLIFARFGFWIAPVVSFSVSVFAEVMQKVLLVQRVSSIQDVMLNTAGALVGWVLAILLSRQGRSSGTSPKR
jgi:glycopeptide antibiotics resistance protein